MWSWSCNHACCSYVTCSSFLSRRCKVSTIQHHIFIWPPIPILPLPGFWVFTFSHLKNKYIWEKKKSVGIRLKGLDHAGKSLAEWSDLNWCMSSGTSTCWVRWRFHLLFSVCLSLISSFYILVQSICAVLF